MESERLLHPIINQIGVDTQNGVIKEEKNSRYDNQPYGKILPIVKENMFESHPYRWSTIGSMEHLDTATLEDFKDFHKKFYIPNNAVLVVAGDFEKTKKRMDRKYFGPIEKAKY
jgi:predicted Zn-dependent peptidase